MTMKTPAITNQYGETCTGIPKGRAITIPDEPNACCAGRWPRLSGVMPATSQMLRAAQRAVTAEIPYVCHPVAGTPGETPRIVGGLPYAPFVDELAATDLAARD